MSTPSLTTTLSASDPTPASSDPEHRSFTIETRPRSTLNAYRARSPATVRSHSKMSESQRLTGRWTLVPTRRVDCLVKLMRATHAAAISATVIDTFTFKGAKDE